MTRRSLQRLRPCDRRVPRRPPRRRRRRAAGGRAVTAAALTLQAFAALAAQCAPALAPEKLAAVAHVESGLRALALNVNGAGRFFCILLIGEVASSSSSASASMSACVVDSASRDGILPFEPLRSRFDSRLGRSAGVGTGGASEPTEPIVCIEPLDMRDMRDAIEYREYR